VQSSKSNCHQQTNTQIYTKVSICGGNFPKRKTSAAELCQIIRMVIIEIVINSTCVMGVCVAIFCRYCIAFDVMLLFLALPVAQPTVSQHLREKCHIPRTCSLQAHLESSNIVSTKAAGYLGIGCQASSRQTSGSSIPYRSIRVIIRLQL